MPSSESVQLRDNVSVVANAQELGERVADYFIDAAGRAIAERGCFRVALAGGSTPKLSYSLLAAEPRCARVDWAHVELFFGDERCVGPTSADSNYRMANETLLQRVSLVPHHVHRMLGEEKPAHAARAYAEILERRLGEPIVFDLIMLGLGTDAHTASWFPGVTIDEQAIVISPFVPKLGVHRLSLGPRVVNAAREIVVATAGVEKAEALAAVFGTQRDIMRFPAQRLAPTSGTLHWMVDKAAARLCQSP